MIETSRSASTINSSLPSDEIVSSTMKKGLEDIIVSTAAGIVVGGLAGVVLARGGASGARKALVGIGGGVGFGSAWTNVSIELENMLHERK